MDLGTLNSEYRTCRECGAEFKTKTVDGQAVTAMMQHSDHLIIHQPTPAQWTRAYNMIAAKRQKSKGE